MSSGTRNSRSRSSSPPSPTTADPRRPLLPQANVQLPPRRVPLRYAWRGKMTWPLRGDPRRYSTFPPYADGNPIVVFGRHVISWLVIALWWLVAALKLALWNFPAGLIIGFFIGVLLCRNSDLKFIHSIALSDSMQPSVPTLFSSGSGNGSVFV